MAEPWGRRSEMPRLPLAPACRSPGICGEGGEMRGREGVPSSLGTIRARGVGRFIGMKRELDRGAHEKGDDR